MRFEHFVKLTNSKLLNKPWIDSYNNIQKDVSKIKQGDLFLCYDTSQIDQAIANGAYAIVTEVDTKIIDEEIAWIKTDSLDLVFSKLLRYSLLEKKIQLFYANEVEFALLKHIVLKKEKIFLDHERDKNYKLIINSKLDSIFISSDKEFLNTIYPNFLTLSFDKFSIQCVKKSLFLSSFIYNELYFENIKLPSIFLHDMQRVLNFLDINAIEYDIRRCNFIDHFKPVFIDKCMNIQKFGTTSSVLIFEQNIDLLKKELIYLEQNAPWAKTVAFLPISLKDQFSTKIKIIYYTNNQEIFDLKSHKFNFALVFSKNNILHHILSKPKNSSLLD